MKKILSFLLAAVLLISLFPVTTFAATEGDFSLVGGAVTVDGTADKTIDVIFRAETEITVTGFEGIFSKSETEDTNYLELSKLIPHEKVVLGTFDTNSITSGRICWADDVNWVGYSVAAQETVWTAQYTVAKDTPAGTYHVQFSLTDLCDASCESALSGKVYTAEIVVTNNSASLEAGYTASATTESSEASVDDMVYVAVNVASNDQANFAAAEIKLNYDADKLTYDESKSTLNGATVKDNGTSLTIEDYGEDQSFGTAYTVAFTAKAKGEATVTLTSAALSTKANAEKKDLIPATISNDTVKFTLSLVHSVNLPGIFKGENSVEDGKDYTFFLADDSALYDYGEITATVGDAEATVIPNGDGSYTVKNVTGNLVITATRTGKTFEVTVTGSARDDVKLPESKPQYGVNYTFEIPAVSGYNVTLTGITYADGTKVPYTTAGNTVTIQGTDITANFTITMDKAIVPPTVATVKVEGNAASDVTAATSAVPGTDFTFQVAEDTHYTYTVTAAIGDKSVDVAGSNGNYTIASSSFKAGDTIVITVKKSIKTDNVQVTKYITLDGTQMWLITVNTEKLDGSVFTYKDQKMLWSEKYNDGNGAYCYLMISAEAQPSVSSDDLAIIQGDVTAVDYGMDVNISRKVDANDAQLVYNMYKASYAEFTDDVTVEKFLRADINGDATVNVEDAAAIINEILK